jgi:SM-20-related protein
MPSPFLDLDRFRRAPLQSEPFEYLIVPGFVRKEARAAINAAFPQIERPGSFPLHGLRYDGAFSALIEEMQSQAMRGAFAEKFGCNLTGRPVTITVRGHCQAKDGRIHTDSETKIITVLLYLNPGWGESGGRLRLLRSADDIEDYAVEVPPEDGLLLAFRRSDRSFHGHLPYVGQRRAVQLNWVTSAAVVWRETFRHRISAWLKRTRPAA